MVLQGSFPGGRPHSTVLLNSRSDYISLAESARTVQALMRHPNNQTIQQKTNNFQRENFTLQSFPVNNSSNVKAYPLNIARLNFRSCGYPIEDDVLQMYESYFGVDLSDVMIHEGDGEAEAAGALAFAAGSDIYFADGLYDPYSPAGIKLLGHEITHVLQQKEGRVKNPLGSNAAFVHDPIMEVEAERMGLNALAAITGVSGLIQMMKNEEEEEKGKACEKKRKRIHIHYPISNMIEPWSQKIIPKERNNLILKYRKAINKKKEKESTSKKSSNAYSVTLIKGEKDESIMNEIVEILKSAQSGCNKKEPNKFLEKMDLFFFAKKNEKKYSNSKEKKLKDDKTNQSTEGIGFIFNEEKTLFSQAFIAGGGKFSKVMEELVTDPKFPDMCEITGKLSSYGSRETCMHAEMEIIRKNENVQALSTTQLPCLFCFGYMEKNNYIHQALRENVFPRDWIHPKMKFKLIQNSNTEWDKPPNGFKIMINWHGDKRYYYVCNYEAKKKKKERKTVVKNFELNEFK